MNCWMDPIQILNGGFLGISCDPGNFWEEFTRWLTEDILKKCLSNKLVGAISHKPLVGSHSY